MLKKTRVLTVVAAMLMALALPAFSRADYRNEKRFDLQPGGHFVIDSSEGDVKLTGQPGAGADVVMTSKRDDFEQLYDVQFDSHPSEVRITVRRKHPWGFNWHNNINLHFVITVPEDTSTEVKTGGGSVEVSRLKRETELETSGGSIRASDLGANLRAHTSGGSIEIDQIKGTARVDTSGGDITASGLDRSLEAETSGGSIHLREIKGDLVAHTSGGSIRIEGAGGRVEAHTSGGSVEVRFDRGNSRGGDIDTSGGGVTVALDRSVNLNLDADASGGSVVTDVPVTQSGTLSRSHIVGTVGSGGALLRVHSSAGSVRIDSL